MATQSKAQYLTDIHTILKKRYKPKAESTSTRLTVLEAVVFGICHEDTSREQATQALARFKDDFFDWNEVRVSSLEEIQAALVGFPNADDRAYRVRRFLRQLFEKTYSFTLEALAKKPLKESVKVLQEYEVLASDYVLATVIQGSLGGHAIPVDESSRRALERLGVVDPGTDAATTRALLERAVPKNRGVEFADLLEELAHDTCVEGIPDCPRCDLRKVCPTALHPPKAASIVAKPAKDETKAVKGSTAKSAPAEPTPALDPAATKPAKGKPGRSK
ncbi:endonuclease-3 [Singulisphaera sp. GP187]|uniref:endonuclease III domain-containing protein n=1 Tax=Singulisphaera sp. GP187 TaxID=1882752 RepID=UPI00092A4C2A|nr:endonuclease [Singulisphaera sp. GP187]SIN88790.1 endonuclease-3 [Singulisphaera sp. GP187]